MKKLLPFVLVILAATFLLSTSISAENESGFTYGFYDESESSIIIKGYTGTLEPGQDLTVPSEIDGKPVVAIEGTYGKKAPNYSTTPGEQYGTFTLPDTLHTIRDVNLYGFTGTLVIPESVTSITGSIGVADVEELVINANIENFSAGIIAYYKENSYPYALKKLVIGDHIKYFTSGLSGFTKLETVELSDSVLYIDTTYLRNSNLTFYLKRFNAPFIEKSNTYPPTFTPTGETTDARAVALNLGKFKYYYTNTDEALQVEHLTITGLKGFGYFDEGTDFSISGQVTTKPGLVAG